MLKSFINKEIAGEIKPLISIVQGALSSEKIQFALFKYHGIRVSLLKKWTDMDLIEWIESLLSDTKLLSRLIADKLASYAFKPQRLENNLEGMNRYFSDEYLQKIDLLIKEASQKDEQIRTMIQSNDFTQEEDLRSELEQYRSAMSILSKMSP